MTLRVVLSAVAGVLSVIGFVPYIRAILRGKTKPVKVTWLIWAALSSITLVGMHFKGAVNGQIIGAALGDWTILALSLTYGLPGWTKMDILCLSGVIVGIVLWMALNDPVLGIVMSLAMMFIGSIPTFASAWKDPSREDRVAWTIFWLSSVAATAAIPAWSWADAAQPLTFLTATIIMMYLLYTRRVPVPTAEAPVA